MSINITDIGKRVSMKHSPEALDMQGGGWYNAARFVDRTLTTEE